MHGIGSPKVINDDVDSGLEQRFHDARKLRRVALHLEELVEFDQPVEKHRPEALLQVGQIDADQIQADPNYASGGEIIEFTLRDHRVDDHDAAQALRLFLEGGHEITVIGAEKARLDQLAVRCALRIELLQAIEQRRIVIRDVTRVGGELQAAPENIYDSVRNIRVTEAIVGQLMPFLDGGLADRIHRQAVAHRALTVLAEHEPFDSSIAEQNDAARGRASLHGRNGQIFPLQAYVLPGLAVDFGPAHSAKARQHKRGQ